jgi:hypothetical protein
MCIGVNKIGITTSPPFLPIAKFKIQFYFFIVLSLLRFSEQKARPSSLNNKTLKLWIKTKKKVLSHFCCWSKEYESGGSNNLFNWPILNVFQHTLSPLPPNSLRFWSQLSKLLNRKRNSKVFFLIKDFVRRRKTFFHVLSAV